MSGKRVEWIVGFKTEQWDDLDVIVLARGRRAAIALALGEVMDDTATVRYAHLVSNQKGGGGT